MFLDLDGGNFGMLYDLNRDGVLDDRERFIDEYNFIQMLEEEDRIHREIDESLSDSSDLFDTDSTDELDDLDFTGYDSSDDYDGLDDFSGDSGSDGFGEEW